MSLWLSIILYLKLLYLGYPLAHIFLFFISNFSTFTFFIRLEHFYDNILLRHWTPEIEPESDQLG
jgi:hypothetical protein